MFLKTFIAPLFLITKNYTIFMIIYYIFESMVIIYFKDKD